MLTRVLQEVTNEPATAANNSTDAESEADSPSEFMTAIEAKETNGALTRVIDVALIILAIFMVLMFI
jgi:hypothetical protein